MKEGASERRVINVKSYVAKRKTRRLSENTSREVVGSIVVAVTWSKKFRVYLDEGQLLLVSRGTSECQLC